MSDDTNPTHQDPPGEAATPSAPTRHGPKARQVGQKLAGAGVAVLALVGIAALLPGGHPEPTTARAAASVGHAPTPSGTPTPSRTPLATPAVALVESEDPAEPADAAAAPATPSPLPVPVLDDAAVRACAVYVHHVGDVVTKQDRSDLARAVNGWARQSAEPQLVSAAGALTDHAGSWTGLWWAVAKAGFADVCRRGTAASAAEGVAVAEEPADGVTVEEPTDDASGSDDTTPAPAGDPSVPEPEEDDSSGCLPVEEVFLDLIPSRPADGIDGLVLPSAWSVQGARGQVVGGFLSSTDGNGEVDGEFGAWFLTDDHVYAYSDAALTRTGWPVTDGGEASERVAAVRACAEADAG